MVATAKSLPQKDMDLGDAEEAMTPLAMLRQAFSHSIDEYRGTRIPGGPAWSDFTFLGRISDSSSHEHKQNFFLFCLILNLRELFNVPDGAAECKLKTDLAVLLVNKDWSFKVLRSAIGEGNVLADRIWQTLSYLGLLRNGKGMEEDTMDLVVKNRLAEENDEKNRDSGREKNKSASSLPADILAELRLRLRKGQIWKDDPWWPKPSKEDEQK